MTEESEQKIVAEDYLDARSKSQGSNRDTEGLGAMAIAGGHGPRAERVFGAADCGNPDLGIL